MGDRRRPFIEWVDDLFPSLLFGTLKPARVCPVCNGEGRVKEQIDEEKFAVWVPCQCQMFCKVCQRWVTREGHPHAEGK